MSLSWNEVRDRAVRFARDWKGEGSEKSERQTFWNEFFGVFGLSRRAVASFEAPVRNLAGNFGFIDLFWRGTLLVEHKSKGQDLDRAQAQAFDYLQWLVNQGRQDELPRYLILCDFARIALFDLEPDDQRDLPLFDRVRFNRIEFPLHELHQHVREFAFIKGEQAIRLDPQDPANEKAYQIMADLHDALAHGGLAGHELERLLVRVLFCLFAEDTSIFEPNAFFSFLEHRTSPDGSDLGARLNQFFEVLNTPEDRRSPRLDEDLAAFPYVNGRLFEERLGFADFNSDMRNALLGCCRFQWAKISPAVFGSLFQGVMEDRARRQQGAHYTSERDIMKVVRSLFLDDLRAEFAKIKGDRSSRRRANLDEFHERLARLKFLDPACGCGNFLVLTYRELRLLELEVLKERYGGDATLKLDLKAFCRVDVDQFYGLETSEWPSLIAEVAMWLLDHQMNLLVSESFGERLVRLPLKKSPQIRCDNALRLDWKHFLPPAECSYVLGNPPFVGKHYQNAAQKADMLHVFGDFDNIGDVDYVVSWFVKAADYVRGTRIRCGLVSTNSITQGEQVPIVWGLLFERYGIKIHFAHRTFSWMSEARGKAHVHVVIIGFGNFNVPAKRIYDYEGDGERATVTEVPNISPYLTPGSDRFVRKQRKPLGDVPEMRCGNKPSDGGHFILTDAERDELLRVEPDAAQFLRRFTGSDEFLNGEMRWCLWLKDVSPAAFRSLPHVLRRIEAVRDFRLKSTAKPTREAAKRPAEFFYINQPETEYILIPEVSSERRAYIPIGFMSPTVVSANTNFIVASSSVYLFGILTSAMHMAWVRTVGGRLKSDYRYSASMVYNTFPWPQQTTTDQRAAVEAAARAVLKARQQFPDATLAELYDPRKIPSVLTKAHAALDRAVDRCYRKEPFPSDRARVEHLFALYEQLTAPLIPAAAKPKRTLRKKATSATAPPPNPVQAEMDAAHYYLVKEEPPPYRTGQDD
jgi:hypothetical protein